MQQVFLLPYVLINYKLIIILSSVYYRDGEYIITVSCV